MGMIGDVMEMARVARIVGWREYRKTMVHLYKNPAARDTHYSDLPLKDRTLRTERNGACRALGLPDDWVYNETELRSAKSHDPVLRLFAIEHLVSFGTDPMLMDLLEKEKQEEREKQLKLAAPRKLLPGARP
jgi:hypothetical protein